MRSSSFLGGSEHLPLVLRRERFGGIVFDPFDGAMLELDQEAFEVARQWLEAGREPEADEARRCLEDIRSELRSPQPRTVRWGREPIGGTVFRHALVMSAPTLVDLQVTRRCNLGCPHCYASSHPGGEHLAFEDAARVLEEIAQAGVCQLAIGGGEPLLHPAIAELIERAHALGIVPNVTTSGEGLTPRVLQVMARCCGAVALSLEDVGPGFALRRKSGFRFFEASHRRLRDAGVRIVYQVTLSAQNLPRLPAIVDYCLSIPELYGVIFLAYKPVGRGRGFHTSLWELPACDVYPMLRDAFLRLAKHTRVGYDCCLTPGITGIDVELGFGDRDLLEGCSAGRSSIGITTDLQVVPCTFATHRPMGSLRTRTLREIWNGPEAEAFRGRLDALGDSDPVCKTCSSRSYCLGGCPEWRLIRCTRAAPESYTELASVSGEGKVSHAP